MTDPATIAFVDQMRAFARDHFPDRSPEWRDAYLRRLFAYATGQPELPPLPED